MKIAEKIKEKLSTQDKMRLGVAMKKSYTTIDRWIKNDDEDLTKRKCVDALVEILELPEEEIFETENE